MSLNELDLKNLHPSRQAGVAMLSTLPRRSVGVEVGVYEGGFSKLIVKTVEPSSLHLVDPWQWRAQWFVKHTDEEQSLIAKGENTEKGEALYEKVKQIFSANPNVKLMRMTSIEASKSFPDNYFDWVFIDGDHRYQPVLEDLKHWWPKVKPGGSICGDDYKIDAPNPSEKFKVANGVRFAVDEFLDEVKLKADFFEQQGAGRHYFKIQKPTS